MKKTYTNSQDKNPYIHSTSHYYTFDMILSPYHHSSVNLFKLLFRNSSLLKYRLIHILYLINNNNDKY